MESPVAAIEFGYPVRFGVAWTGVTACKARIVTSATVLIPNLMSPRSFWRVCASGEVRKNRDTEARYCTVPPKMAA